VLADGGGGGEWRWRSFHAATAGNVILVTFDLWCSKKSQTKNLVTLTLYFIIVYNRKDMYLVRFGVVDHWRIRFAWQQARVTRLQGWLHNPRGVARAPYRLSPLTIPPPRPTPPLPNPPPPPTWTVLHRLLNIFATRSENNIFEKYRSETETIQWRL
jgi:hypothetical protein